MIVNGYHIRQNGGLFHIFDRGHLLGALATMAAAIRFAEEAITPDPTRCPNCGNSLAHSSFYERPFCFACYWMPDADNHEAAVALADEIL